MDGWMVGWHAEWMILIFFHENLKKNRNKYVEKKTFYISWGGGGGHKIGFPIKKCIFF